MPGHNFNHFTGKRKKKDKHKRKSTHKQRALKRGTHINKYKD